MDRWACDVDVFLLHTKKPHNAPPLPSCAPRRCLREVSDIVLFSYIGNDSGGRTGPPPPHPIILLLEKDIQGLVKKSRYGTNSSSILAKKVGNTLH